MPAVSAVLNCTKSDSDGKAEKKTKEQEEETHKKAEAKVETKKRKATAKHLDSRMQEIADLIFRAAARKQHDALS